MVSFDAELSAMQQIAQTLALFDDATRLRIVHWMTERFVPAAAQPRPPAVSMKPRLVVNVHEPIAVEEDLADLFDPQAPAPAPAPRAEVDAQSIGGLLSEFVAEFQGVVREWNGACDLPVEEGAQAPAPRGAAQRASNAA